MDPSSPQRFDEIRQWMGDCLHDHQNCLPKGVVKLPTRLIQLSALGAPEWAKLVYQPDGTEGQYCALSYCWGGDQEYKTLGSRYEQYKQGLPCDCLPKTITDAFRVARNLHIEYIWIDSLCIIQDDKDDKQKEIAKMMDIYQHAQLTISVAGASKADQGFLFDPLPPMPGLYHHPIRVRIHNKEHNDAVIVKPMTRSSAERLNERGWTLQESLLAPRLLIYTDLMTVWKCHEGFQPNHLVPLCDNVLRSRDSPSLSSVDYTWETWYEGAGYASFPSGSFQSGTLVRETPHDDALRRDWHYVVEQYSQRHLTDGRDRLPALSAIAKAFASPVDGTYHAGLWDKTMVYDLAWIRDETSPGPSVWNAGPSWSWATHVDKPCRYQASDHIARAEVISCHTTLVSADNLYGQVCAGELTI